MPMPRDPMFSDQGLEQPILHPPADPRGGFANVQHGYVHTVGLAGGPTIIDTGTSEVLMGYWNDGANP